MTARVGFVLAVVALVAYAIAGALLILPVEVPSVQDCGAPGAYLISGRLDVVPDPDGLILGPDGQPLELPPAVADAARERPCRDRVAVRAVPAIALVVGATVLAPVAATLSLIRPRRHREATWRPPPPTRPTGPTGSPPVRSGDVTPGAD